MKTHKLSNTSIYHIWQTMKQRCTNPKCKYWYRYWGRWIKLCDKRYSFMWFYEDMADTYKEWLSIDRINNDGNYCKENCRWTTMKVQSNNRSNNTIVKYWEDLREVAKDKWCSRSFFGKCMRKSWYNLEKAKELADWKNDFNPTKHIYKWKNEHQRWLEFWYSSWDWPRYMMKKHNLTLEQYVEWVLSWKIHKGTLCYNEQWWKQRRIMSNELTPSQKKVYDYYKGNEWTSYSEASKILWLGTSVIFNSVKILERKWYIEKKNWKIYIINK